MALLNEVRTDEATTYHGTWKIGGPQSYKTPGTLTYSPANGLMLEIVKPVTYSDVMYLETEARACISGQATEHKHHADVSIALLDFWVRDTPPNRLHVSANRALITPRYSEDVSWDFVGEEAAIERVRMRVPNIGDWLGWKMWPGANELMPPDAAPHIRLSSPGDAECKLASGELREFRGWVHVAPTIGVGGVPDGMSLSCVPMVDLVFDSPRTLSDASWLASKTAFLLGLLIGCNSPIQSLAFGREHEDYYQLGKNISDLAPKRCLGQPLTRASDYCFADLLDKWLVLSEQLAFPRFMYQS